MSAGQHNLYIEQGATYNLALTWCGGATVETNGSVTITSPFNLTGYIARMQIRKKQGTTVLVSATTANGKITLGGTAGTITIKLTAEDTDLLTSRSCAYDLEVESATGDVYRVLQGLVEVSPNITQVDGSDPVVVD